MGIVKAIANLLDFRYQKQLGRCEDAIADYIYEPLDDLLVGICRNPLVKEHVVSLVQKAGKGVDENIRLLYRKLGFYHEDIRLLQQKPFRKKLYALVRLMALKETIPHSLHLNLLNDNYDAIKWQAMNFYIDIYNKKAFFKLVVFMDNENNQRQAGLLYYIVSEYISRDRDALLPIVTRVQGETLRGVFFKVMESLADPAAEDVVFRLIGENSSIDSIISAIKITMNSGTERSFLFFEIMSSHESGPVRMFVAKALKGFTHSDSFAVLKRLSEDDNYLVRQYSCQSLIKHNTYEANSYLRQIFNDKNHPAYQILRNEFVKENFKGNHGI